VANIQLKITALGDFSSVNNQLKALQTQVQLLQKSIAGVGLNANLTTQLKNVQGEFGNALVSSGNFTKQTVQLTSETEKFGAALQAGKLRLGDYFGIITGKSAAAQKSVQALAVEQVKLNNSIVQQDITKQGVYSVYTPTTINATAKAVEIATAKQNIFNIAVQQGSQKLIDFGKNTQWAGRQLTVGLSMPALLFGSQAVAAFKAVNTELTRLQRLYGEGLTPPSQAQLNQISNQVLKLGAQVASQMGIAQSETTNVAANFAAMGKEGQNLLDVTYQAQRLSKLGALDATQATNTIVSLQNVYKVSTTDLANAVNFMSSMQKQTTMSLQDMTDAIPRVGPIMAELGGSYKDTAVMLLAMREAGVPAAQAANALKSAFASIIAPTSAASKEFASFGINLDKIKSAGTPVQMLMSLQSALVGIAPLAREQLIEKLFGKFQFARVSALLDNFGKVGSQTQNALKVAGATNAQLATLAGQEMAQATASTTAKWQRAIEGLKASLYPIGQKILEVGSKILEFGQKIADFFNKLPGPIKSGLGILLTLGVIAGPVIMITGLFANLMGQVMKVGYSLLGVIDGSKKWKDLMTPAGIAAKTATDVFQTGLLENVTAVDTLNAALQRLITSLEAINMNFSVGTGTSLLGKVEAAAATEVASGQIVLPGMATGGYVPGSGNSDSYPAMLTPGEAVIPKAAAAQHAPLISALISGNLPGYAEGYDPEGNPVIVQRGHAYSSHNSDILEKARALLPTQSRLSSVDDVTKGVMVGMTSDLNQSVRSGRSGISSSGVASELERYQSLTGKGGAKLDPMADLKIAAQKLGADMSKAGPMLDQAYKDMIKTLKDGPEQMFGKKAGQVSLETWMEQQLKPTLAKIETEVGGNLGGALERVATIRGRQPLKSGGEKTGATGSTYWIDDNGNLVPLKESGTRLSTSDVSTMGRAAPGAVSRSKKAGSTMVDDIKTAAQEEAKIKSPSQVFENEVGAQIAAGTMKGVEEGVSGPTGQSKIQSIFSKSFGGASSTAGKAISRFSNMGMMGKVGVGMGLGMVTQMASPLLNKIPGGNLISDAMSGASMGAGFGLWGMAAGAAISLVTGGIKSLMAMEKQHAAEAKADFTSSADAVQFLGGKVADTTTALHTITSVITQPVTNAIDNLTQHSNTLAKGIVYTNDQLSSFETTLKNLPANNPLSLVAKQIKDTADSGAAAKLAQDFANTQMAINGISPQQAKQLEQLLLTQGGHDPNSALSLMPNQILAIKQALDSALPDATQFAKVLGDLVMGAANASNLQQYNTYIQGIGNSAATASQQLQALLGYFNSNPQVEQLIKDMITSGKGFNGQDVAASVAALNNGQNINFDSLTPGQVAKELGNNAGMNPAKIALLKQQADIQNQITAATNGTAVATATATAATANNVKGLEAQQKVLNNNLKTLQDLQKQANQATSWQSTKEDLKNQILMAQATGDNLKAQLLQQQLISQQGDYNRQGAIDTAQKAADANQAKLDAANAAVTTAQTTATNSNTGALTILQGKLDALNKEIASLPGGKINYSKSSGAATVPSLKTNQNAPDAGAQTLDPKTHTLKTAGYGPGQVTPRNSVAPQAPWTKQMFHPKANGMHNYAINKLPAPYGELSYFDKTTGYSYDPHSGMVLDKNNKPIGQWAAPNEFNIMTGYAKGGVARTNSSITYHKQHMNRISRHFDTGGHVAGPGSATSDSIPAMLSNGEYVINAGAVSHYGKGTFDALNARHLAKGGVARTNSSITYHKQHMNRISRHFAAGGFLGPLKETFGEWKTGLTAGLEFLDILPTLRVLGGQASGYDWLGPLSIIGGLGGKAAKASLMPKSIPNASKLIEAISAGQFAMETKANAASTKTPTINAPATITMNVTSSATADELAQKMKLVLAEHVARTGAAAKMSGTTSRVGS
jgi:TP901 family phage tail tape measure protein